MAAATSGRAVLISGMTVIIAMAGMFLTGNTTFMGMGLGTILVVAVAVLGSLTVLPAILAALGDRINKGRIPLLRRRSEARDSRAWGWLVDRVMRRPLVAAVLAGGLLVALTIPAFGMQTKLSGTEDLPQGPRHDPDVPQGPGRVPVRGRSGDRRGRGERRQRPAGQDRRSPASRRQSRATTSSPATIARGRQQGAHRRACSASACPGTGLGRRGNPGRRAPARRRAAGDARPHRRRHRRGVRPGCRRGTTSTR